MERFIASALLVLLCACASPYKDSSLSLAPEDRAAFEGLANKHLECLGENTARYERGSQDVAFLTRHISSLCEPVLTRLREEIITRGYNPAFAAGYVNASRDEGQKITASTILRGKSKTP